MRFLVQEALWRGDQPTVASGVREFGDADEAVEYVARKLRGVKDHDHAGKDEYYTLTVRVDDGQGTPD